jgi:hypothetical protein
MPESKKNTCKSTEEKLTLKKKKKPLLKTELSFNPKIMKDV